MRHLSFFSFSRCVFSAGVVIPIVFATAQVHVPVIDYDFRHVSLRAALDTLINRYGLSVAFRDNDLEGRTVSGRCTGCTGEEALTTLLEGTTLTWRKMEGQFILVPRKPERRNATTGLSGVIIDGTTKDPLPLANITVKGTSMGAAADVAGRYSLRLGQGSHDLIASAIGYRAESVPVTLHDEDCVQNIALFSTDIMLQEVTVYASPGENAGDHEVSSLTLQSKRISESSSVIPDVLRAIQFLPGIAVNNEFSAKFNVRGGNADENLVLVNDTQVYEPFHVKEASNASIGIFSVDLMRKVDLITGGFGARYGDKMSSVVNIEYREGSKEKYKGAATLSLINLDSYVEGPLGPGGSFIIGGRKSYLEYVMSMLDVKRDPHVTFYDIQGVLSYAVSGENKIVLQFIHAGDRFHNDPRSSAWGPQVRTGTYFGSQATSTESYQDYDFSHGKYLSTMFDLQSRNILSRKASMKAGMSYYDQVDEEYGISSSGYTNDIQTSQFYFYRTATNGLYDNNLRIRTWEGKTSFDIQMNPFFELVTGVSYQNISYQQDLTDQSIRTEEQNMESFPDTTNVRLDEKFTNAAFDRILARSYKLAGYVENLWQVDDDLIVNIGGRVDYFDFNRDWNWSPRLGISYRLNSGTTLRAAWGYFYQSPVYRQLASATPSDTNTQAQRAIHYLLGIEHKILFDESNDGFLTLKAEGYHKDYDNLVSSKVTTSGRIDYSHRNDATGSASGVDIFVSLNVPRFYGWISYGYLQASETLQSGRSGAYPRSTDQRHTLSVVADVDLGEQWSLNGRFSYGSGFPYTPSLAVYDADLKRNIWVQAEKNSAYLPTYRRLDLRLSKQMKFWDLPVLAFLDFSNVLGFTNIYGYQYTFNNDGSPKVEELTLWPFLPTFGLTVKF